MNMSTCSPKEARCAFAVGLGLSVLAMLALACGQAPDAQDDGPRDPDAGRTRHTIDELPPRPPFPESRNGRLVAVSAGDYEIQGAWRTRAGVCEEIGIVEMYAGRPDSGTAIVLRLPDDEALGEYPVVAAAAEFPPAPAALIAVQVFDPPDALGFQAYHGMLELLEFGDRLSGRFAATLRDVSLDILTHYVGVFANIPVESLAADYCESLRNSTFPTESTIDSDSSTVGN